MPELNGKPWVRRFAGLALTLALALLVEGLRATPLRISNPPSLFVLAIVFTGFTGGLVPALASALIAWAYTAYFFIGSGPSPHFEDDLRRVLVWAVTMPLTAWMVGVLNRRAASAMAKAELAAMERAQAEAQRRSEEALRESHDLLRAVIEGTPDAIYVKDLQGRYRMINSAGARIVGKTVEDVIGKEDADFLAPSAARTIRERDIHVLSSGETETFEESIAADTGSRTYLSTKSPYRDRRGSVIGLVGISRDITEMKRLEADFRQAQKMEAVGRLAGGVAHDFNNLLSVIIGYSELVFNRLPPDDSNRGYLYEVQKAGDRAAALTRQLLAFSRKQVLQSRVMSLNPLLIDLCAMLQRLIGEDIELVQALDTDLGMVKADPVQFEQAIINLSVNARDTMPGTGRLTIATRNARLDEGYAERHPEVRPGEYVVVSVTDTGHGMDDATKARIFEPFFTTKESGKGTGLGLAMVYGFLKQSGGHVEVESEQGIGTTFRLFLPRDETADLPSMPSPEDAGVPKGTETLLLVEDEESLRTLTRMVLQTYGYTVLEAGDGKDGIAAAERFPGTIHALVADLVMPHMGGRELADFLVGRRPGLRVLFMSGHTEDSILQRGMAEAGTLFFHKPFTPLALARRLRQLLDMGVSGPLIPDP